MNMYTLISFVRSSEPVNRSLVYFIPTLQVSDSVTVRAPNVGGRVDRIVQVGGFVFVCDYVEDAEGTVGFQQRANIRRTRRGTFGV